MHDIINQLLSYLKAAWQYRWYAAALSWVVCLAGFVVVYLLPNKFEASARVYVDTQSVLRPLLAGLAVQPNVDQQVSMMSRTLISRPNMEKVLRMSDMDIRYKTPEDKDGAVDRLTKEIELKAAGRENLYTITYADKRPEDAKRVVQSLLTIFVEGSLGDKRKDADQARRFIDEQIKAYEQKLMQAENALKEFKRKNAGMMPEEGKDYYSRVKEATTRLGQARLELREAENARDAMKRQLTGEEPVFLGEEQAATAAVANPEIDGRIQALRARLDQLRLQFTEQHPDIVATKRIIQQLEEQKRQEAKTKPPALVQQQQQQNQRQNPVFQQLSVSIAEAEAKVASLKVRVVEFEAQAEQLKAAANMIPQVEADLTQLNRDYEVNKKNYEALLARRESAQISGEMDATASVVDFRIIDPPRVPPTPSSPKRALLVSVVTAGAIFGGFGLAFLLSQLRPTVNDRRTAQAFPGVPVFGVVTRIWTDAQRRRRRRNLFVLALSYLGLLGSYGAFMGLLFLTGKA